MAEGQRTKETEESSAFHVPNEELKRRVEAIMADALKSFVVRLTHSSVDLAVEPSGSVVERAVQVIGDRQEALRWMGTPVRALDYATPIALLGQPDGEERVMTVLMQLEHGVL